jgi:penicillin amidase
MLQLLKLIIIISGVITLLTVSIISLIYYLLLNSIPDYNLNINDKSLKYPVEIIRDAYAIPHIYGESDEDIFFALGFAHAQDRLWQMIILRRTAHGELAEIFGEKSLQSDILHRTLNIQESSKASLKVQSKKNTKSFESIF